MNLSGQGEDIDFGADQTASEVELNSSITGVWSFVVQDNLRELSLMIVICFVLEGIIVYALFNVDSKNALSIVPYMLAPIVIFLIWYGQIILKYEAAFLKDFATVNGFNFFETGVIDKTYGAIFRTGGTGKATNIVSGTYHSHEFQLFLFAVVDGSGRGSRTYNNTVFEITVDGRLPSLLLEPKNLKLTDLDLLGTSGLRNEITLEGGFSDRFTLHSERDGQVEALEVFTPDIMAIIEDETKGYVIEFVGNKIYIYIDKYLTKRDDLDQAFLLAKKLIEQVAPIASRLGSIGVMPVPVTTLRSYHSLRWKSVILNIFFFLFIAGTITAITLLSTRTPSLQATKSSNPAYDNAARKADSDIASSTVAHNNGDQIIADGQAMIVAATTDLGHSGGEDVVGRGYFWKLDYAAALTHERAAITLDPNNSSALSIAGNLLVNLHQPTEAIMMANRQLAVNPADSSAFRIIAFAKANSNLQAAALEAINKAIELDTSKNASADVSYDQEDKQGIIAHPGGFLYFEP